MLREVGIPEPEHRYDVYPHELSGGLRQRILVAAALACDPQLLIADEPTTALDVTLQAQILRLLDTERRSRKMGLLFITHDLGVVAQVCDRVAVMYAGRIAEIGPTAEVFARPRHPYTAGLLAAVRALDAGTAPGGRLPALRGMVPPLERFEPEGCRFRDRCDLADDRCKLTPPLQQGVACHHPLP
jgi:peptide/nickel transport system ATP-binding protein